MNTKQRFGLTTVGIIIAALAIFVGSPGLGIAQTRETLPIPDPPFQGKIGLRPSDSVKDFPAEAKAPEGAPNVLLILTDDVGMSGTTLGPEEAYRFARGEEVTSTTGLRVKLRRPLDFLVVADHAETLGLIPMPTIGGRQRGD